MNLEAGRIAAQHSSGGMLSRLWHPSRRVLRSRMRFALIIIDIACLLGSFAVSGLIYDALFGAPTGQELTMGLIILPIYLGFALNGGAFSVAIFSERGKGLSLALQALLLSSVTLVLVAFYLKIGESFSRATLATGTCFAILSLSIARGLFLRHARELLGGNVYSTVMISDGAQTPVLGNISAYISADSWLNPEQDCPMMYDRLATALKGADRVIVNCAPERRLAWVNALKGANIRSEVVAPELDELAPMGTSYWGDTPTLIVADGPLSRMDALIKRSFDLAVSIAALVVLMPLFAVIALIIKRESEGPVFFMQTRIGLGNQQFKMFKFRSMRVESCDSDGSQSTARDDNRITRVGAFIRKTSIDELPQLVNVLLGDMSIVGPRPHALGSRAADKLFWEVDNRYWHRHATKPGLTGLAQVRGFRGATEHEHDLTNRLYADLEYLRDWSIWRDMMILLQTARVVVHRNAF